MSEYHSITTAKFVHIEDSWVNIHDVAAIIPTEGGTRVVLRGGTSLYFSYTTTHVLSLLGQSASSGGY